MRLISRGSDLNIPNFVIDDPLTKHVSMYWCSLAKAHDHYIETSSFNPDWFDAALWSLESHQILLESDNLDDFRYENLLTRHPELFI